MSGGSLQRAVSTNPTGSHAPAAGLKSSLKSRDLLDQLQTRSPELRAEDAFVVPIWFSQQKTWLRDPLHSDNFVYNFPLLLHLRGPLNESALRRGLQEIVKRHEVLRSVFRLLDGDLVQIIVPAPDLSLTVTDLSGLAESARDARVQQLALEEANRPFDLARGPLFRG